MIYFVREAAEEKQQAKAKLSREDTLKLDSKQVTSFRDIVLKETEKWKKCIQKTWGRKKYLESLNFKEINLVLTVDPYWNTIPAPMSQCTLSIDI